jgi:hypothetical protein
MAGQTYGPLWDVEDGPHASGVRAGRKAVRNRSPFIATAFLGCHLV